MPKEWTAEDIMNLAHGFQPACLLAAAAELDIFTTLAEQPLTAEVLAQKLQTDLRATTILADALAALELLNKQGQSYSLAPGIANALTPTGSESVLAMIQHLANCLRKWAQLAKTTKTGQPEETAPSIRGPEADTQSFIEAMNDICLPTADPLVREIAPTGFHHLLDLGAGPATWTIAFLRTNPTTIAIGVWIILSLTLLFIVGEIHSVVDVGMYLIVFLFVIGSVIGIVYFLTRRWKRKAGIEDEK